MMTVMLLVPNPKRIRLALNGHREASEFPFEETYIVDLDHPEEETTAEETTAAVDQQPPARTEVASSSSPEPAPSTSLASAMPSSTPTLPVQVASADPTASFGYRPLPTKSLSEREKAAVTVTPTPVPTNETPATPLDIPVPDPEQIDLPMKVASLAPRHDSAAPTVLQPLTPVQEVPTTANPAPFPAVSTQPVPSTVVSTSRTPTPPVEIEPVVTTPVDKTPVELSTDLSMSIIASEDPQRWNFRFQDSQLQKVFKVLAEYQGCTVILDEELSGRQYSGEFMNAEPAQVFAILVKTYHCRVSRRGNVLLLSVRAPETFR